MSDGSTAALKARGLELMECELKYVGSEELKALVRKVLYLVDDTFWTMPASRTGKNHPPQDRCPGGLVNHSIITAYFANRFSRCYGLTAESTDIVICASLIHDIGKAMGEPHDKLAADWLVDLTKGDPNYSQLINCVRRHLGRWGLDSPDFNNSNIFGLLERIVHMADYTSTQKALRIDWDDMLPGIQHTAYGLEPEITVDRRTWEEFRALGLLWWINRLLHTFGWAIVVDVKDDKVVEAYPARVKFRGFEEKQETEGFIRISELMKANAEELVTEAKS